VATRILLVDDNPQDRLLTRRALAAAFDDLEAIEAIDQAQLDAALHGPRFDLVVTDFQLHWSDGLTVLSQAHESDPGVPVIMFTNTGTEEIAAAGVRLRLADYIVKSPGHYSRLAHAARTAIDRSSERRRLVAQLEQRSQLLALSFEPIFSWELDGGITEWNAGCERLYGYTREEALGHESHELLRTQEPPPIADMIATLRRTGRWSGELVHHTKDGREVNVEGHLQLMEIGGRAIVLESNRDITERKRAIERTAFMSDAGALLAGSLDYETTLAAVASLAVPRVSDWCAVDVVSSDGTLERLAVARRDPADLTVDRALAPFSDPAAPAGIPHVVRTGHSVLVRQLPDSGRVLSFLCVPLVARTRTLGTLSCATAMSRRRFTDEDLQIVEQIAHRAALAVDNAQAYKAMQVTDRLKDEFLATLSHELRTPLNAILGYARLLRSGVVSLDKAHRAIEIVERNAATLTHLVDDILDVSRIISGKVRLNIQPVDLPTLVRNAVETLAPAAEAKQLQIATDIDANAAPISGDADRLQQVVWNLVSNAVKFTSRGGHIDVSVSRSDAQIDIVVRDTGIGIKPELLPHIFERFRQGDSGSTRQFGGLGLGLAIVRHLVELHGGTVEASSDGEGRGATFRVRLPRLLTHYAPAVTERRSRTRDVAAVGAPAGRLADVHVLAVDDNVDALALIQEILELAGARVTTSDSGASAIELANVIRPDVLVADVGLPDVSGFELVRRLRQSADVTVRATPAIALTAYARAVDRVTALESGFSMHLSKPADPAELVAAIAAVARKRADDLS
jgi:PAS domain S-box-containing protein